MIYVRGNRNDFQAWRDEHGCAGWGYEDLMPYFRRAEDNSRGASPSHGTGGPLAVSDPRYTSKACQAFIAAAVEQGATRAGRRGPDRSRPNVSGARRPAAGRAGRAAR